MYDIFSNVSGIRTVPPYTRLYENVQIPSNSSQKEYSLSPFATSQSFFEIWPFWKNPKPTYPKNSTKPPTEVATQPTAPASVSTRTWECCEGLDSKKKKLLNQSTNLTLEIPLYQRFESGFFNCFWLVNPTKGMVFSTKNSARTKPQQAPMLTMRDCFRFESGCFSKQNSHLFGRNLGGVAA